MSNNFRVCFLALALTILTAGCGEKSENMDHDRMRVSQGSAEWDQFVLDFMEATFQAHPNFAVVQGRHELDGKFPDWSKKGIDAEIARLHAARDAAGSFSAADLTAHQGFQREYVVAVIDRILFWLEDAEWPYRNPAFYFDWTLDSLDPTVYVARKYGTPEQRARGFIWYAEGLSGVADQIIANLRSPMPRAYIDYGVATFGGLASFFQDDVGKAFADLSDPHVAAELDGATAIAAGSMKRIVDWFEGQRADATDDFAIGETMFLQMLAKTEGVGTTIRELRAIGEADLERNLQALDEACAAYSPSADIPSCVAKIGADKPEGGTVAGATRQIDMLKSFLRKEDIVPIPGEEMAVVREAPPYMRSNIAYIDIPGPFEANLPSIYYIAPPDPGWSKDDQIAYVPGKNLLLFISVHEVWPGHFLQYLHAKHSNDDFGRVFIGYAFAEGWAHYAEELMWEAGLGDGDPGVHIGQLLDALMRDVRYLSAIGLHTGSMTVEASEHMFTEKAFLDPGNARQQAQRGTYDPAYLNYTMGKLMIRKLRADWTRKRGDRLSWKAFHNRFLSFGGPPIPLVRQAMMVGGDDSLF